MKQEKNNFGSQLIVTSVMMIICGLWHMLWRILSTFVSVTDKVQRFGTESFVYNEISSYFEILGSGSSMAAVHRLLMTVVVPLQIGCGIVGIISDQGHCQVITQTTVRHFFLTDGILHIQLLAAL